MKASTLAVLKREARLVGNQARFGLLQAQAAQEEQARLLAEQLAACRARRAELTALREGPRPTLAGDAVRREAWLARRTAEVEALEELAGLARRELAQCEAAVDEQRQRVVEALRRQQAIDALLRTLRAREMQARERRQQGQLDEIAAWRSTRLDAGKPGSGTLD